jgi:hypothetical protein
MKRTQITLVMLLCVAVMVGCKKKEEAVALEPVNVTISMDPATNMPKADPDPVSVKPNQEVVWLTSPAGQDFEVTFKTETPFRSGRFDRAANKSGKSHITVPPGQERRFSYAVTFQGKTTDPEVIIKPGGGSN